MLVCLVVESCVWHERELKWFWDRFDETWLREDEGSWKIQREEEIMGKRSRERCICLIKDAFFVPVVAKCKTKCWYYFIASYSYKCCSFIWMVRCHFTFLSLCKKKPKKCLKVKMVLLFHHSFCHELRFALFLLQNLIIQTIFYASNIVFYKALFPFKHGSNTQT